MKLRRYCVTVMDNWTPTRLFWTKAGAVEWHAKSIAPAYLWKWQGHWGGFWEDITPAIIATVQNTQEAK